MRCDKIERKGIVDVGQIRHQEEIQKENEEVRSKGTKTGDPARMAAKGSG